jgi:uncharacterized protein YndB with AHSA1/START domain
MGAEKQDLVITRVFDAPLEQVWQAWTDCEVVMQWWGPAQFTSPSCRIDFREGGSYLFHMRAPEAFGGGDFYTAGAYERIVPMERIEFAQVLADEDGQAIDPAEVGMPADFPPEVRTTLTFKRMGDQTELTVTEYDWPAGQMRELSATGMNESLDKLAEALAAG